MEQKEKVWRIEGDYLESCNCDVVCPCLVNGVGNNKVPATDGHCDLFLAYTIDKGHYEDIDLAGVNFVLACYSPGPLMLVENWSIAYYVDETATEQQFDALEKILTGKAGGTPVALTDCMEVNLGFKRARVTIEVRDRELYAAVDGVGECTVKAIKGMHDDSVVELKNIHPQTQGGDCVQCLTGQMWYRDHGYSFNNTGRSGLYARYIWADNLKLGARN